MLDKERDALVKRILSVDKNPKNAKVAEAAFLSKAKREDAQVFFDNLQNKNQAIRKISRHILGKMGIREALPLLLDDLQKIAGNLTFQPESEFSERQEILNMVEILEATFQIIRQEKIRDKNIFGVFKALHEKTENEDLRFSLIKLLGTMGEPLSTFLAKYQDMGIKARRALYLIYSQIPDPQRGELFKLGMTDKENLEYLLPALIACPEGKSVLNQVIETLDEPRKQLILQVLQGQPGQGMEEALIVLFQDISPEIARGARDLLLGCFHDKFPQERFEGFIFNGLSGHMVENALQIIDHFVFRNPEEVYLRGFCQQANIQFKQVILNHWLERLKRRSKLNPEVNEQAKQAILTALTNYFPENDDYFVTLLKLLASLKYRQAADVSAMKKEINKFLVGIQKIASVKFKNKFQEVIVKLNHVQEKLEKLENAIQDVLKALAQDTKKIEPEIIEKFIPELQDLKPFFNDNTSARIRATLMNLFGDCGENWKLKVILLNFLFLVGEPQDLPFLLGLSHGEGGLAVKIEAEKIINHIKEKYDLGIPAILLMVPQFLLNKRLNEFFAACPVKIYNVPTIDEFMKVSEICFRYIFLSDEFLDTLDILALLDTLDNRDTRVVLVTVKPGFYRHFIDQYKLQILDRSFRPGDLQSSIEGNLAIKDLPL